MEHLEDPYDYVGLHVMVKEDEYSVIHEFQGTVVGVRNGFLKVRDQDNNLFEVEMSQVTPIL